jgi:hypothetical protein
MRFARILTIKLSFQWRGYASVCAIAIRSGVRHAALNHNSEPDHYFTDEDLVKSGFGGEHIESNHRLMYT